LQQAPDEYQRRGQKSDALISGHQHDQQGPTGHDRQGYDQPFAPAYVIDVGPEDHRTQWAHEEACAKHGEGHHQRGEFVGRGKEGRRDMRGIEAEQEEVELFEEVSGRDPEDHTGLGLALGHRV